jgi:hypothetical protein
MPRVIAGGPQFADISLGEILVFAAKDFGHLDEVDLRIALERL